MKKMQHTTQHTTQHNTTHPCHLLQRSFVVTAAFALRFLSCPAHSLWDHRNASLRDFLVNVVVGGPDALGNPAIDGLFLDDFWSNFAYKLPWAKNPLADCSVSDTGGPSEIVGGCIEVMGLSADDVEDIAEGWLQTTHAVFAKIVAMKGCVALWCVVMRCEAMACAGLCCTLLFRAS